MAKLLVFGGSSVYGTGDHDGGWVQRLRKFADERNKELGDTRREVFNLGIYGDATYNLLQRFSVEAKARTRLKLPDENIIVVFHVGANDSQYIKSKEKRRATIEQFSQNINQLIKEAKTFTDKVIFIGLSLVDESLTAPLVTNEDIYFDNEAIIAYDDKIKELAIAQGVYYLPIRDAAVFLDDDGLHQNQTGHVKIFEIVRNFLVKNTWI